MSIAAKRGIHFLPGSAHTIHILPNTQKTLFFMALFIFFSNIFQISVLMIQNSNFAWKLGLWTWILIFFFRLIFICISIVWRSLNKNTILHAAQKKGQKSGVLRAFETYKMPKTRTYCDFFKFLGPPIIWL